MDIREYFAASSDRLRADFERTKQLLHGTGKGDAREAALVDVLEKHLPKRYAFARGEVVSSQGYTSRQCDAVIYDAHRCPRLFVSDQYGVYPIESVYGVMEVKSTLSSGELESAHDNIVSLKRLAGRGRFNHTPIPMLGMALERPRPVGLIVGYCANRSMDAIADQLRRLNEALPSLELAPDFVVVVGKGYVGPAERIRNNMNEVRPLMGDDLCMVHHAGRHTLLLLYLRLLDELDQLTLETPDLRAYLNAPTKMGGHMVHGGEIHVPDAMGGGQRRRLKPAALKRIVKQARASGAISYLEHLHRTIGPLGRLQEMIPGEVLSRMVYEYNPRGLPPVDLRVLSALTSPLGRSGVPVGFVPMAVVVDGEEYFIDITATHLVDDWDVVGDETPGEYQSLRRVR